MLAAAICISDCFDLGISGGTAPAAMMTSWFFGEPSAKFLKAFVARNATQGLSDLNKATSKGTAPAAMMTSLFC